MKHPLRDLAAQITRVTQCHPAYSQAIDIVKNCTDHLSALALSHETNFKLHKVEVLLSKSAQISGDDPGWIPGTFPWKTA